MGADLAIGDEVAAAGVDAVGFGAAGVGTAGVGATAVGATSVGKGATDPTAAFFASSADASLFF